MRSTAVRLAPGALIWLSAAAVLVGLDTGWTAVLRYSVFLAFGIMLPGALLWRLLRGNVDGFGADLTFGTGVALALSVAVYIPARAIGQPLLALAFPVLTIAVFALPRFRHHWRSRGPVVPVWWSWWTAGACAAGFAVVNRIGVMNETIRFPAAAFQYVDMPFHLALAGELKHHFPAQIPYVTGESLHYHWFTYAHLASASWQTGIELDVLLRRLLPVMVTVVAIGAIAALATRLARRPELAWAGPLAAWLAVLVTSFDVFGWNGVAAVSQNSFSTVVQIYSPTHAFGLVLALSAVWLIADLLRGAANRRGGTWLLLVLMLLGLGGAKASFLPLFAAGVALVIAVRLVSERRFERTDAAVVGATVAALVFAQVVLFGGSSAGTTIDALKTYQSVAVDLGFAGTRGQFDASGPATFSTMVTLLVSWGMVGIGMLGFARRGAWRDPAAALVAGCLIAGLGAASLLYQHGSSQFYFIRAAFPIAAAGSAWGLALLFDQVPLRVLVPRLLGAAGLGLGLTFALNALNRDLPDPTAGDIAVVWRTTWPWGLAIAVVVAAGLLIRRFAPASWRLRGLTLGLCLVMLLGSSAVLSSASLAKALSPNRCAPVPTGPSCADAVRRVPFRGEEAARFIRAHSSPDDVIATNSHCAPTYQSKFCESRNFWLSAYAERRVLLHGWAYTPTSNAVAETGFQAFYGDYWDPRLRFANDVVFHKPTSFNVGRLLDQHGVRWLVLDRNVNPPPVALLRLARQRFEAGAIVVYEIGPRRATSPQAGG